MTKYFSLLLLVVLIIMPLSVSTTFAWQGPPPGTPPDCDPAVYPGCNPPINVGTATQIKNGILGAIQVNTGSLYTVGTLRDIMWKTREALQIGEWDGTTFTEKMRLFNNIVGIHSTNVLEFNYNAPTNSKQVNAGKIGYSFMGPPLMPALDIVGAGPSVGSRVVKIWDKLATKELCNEDGTVCGLVTNIINNNGGGFWTEKTDANGVSLYPTNVTGSKVGINSPTPQAALHVGSAPTLIAGQVPKVIIVNTNDKNTYDQGLFVQNAGKGWAIHAKSTNPDKTGLRVEGKVMIDDGRGATLVAGQVPKVIIANENVSNTYDQGLFVQNAGKGWAIEAKGPLGIKADGGTEGLLVNGRSRFTGNVHIRNKVAIISQVTNNSNSTYDINGDKFLNAIDIQIAINCTLGISSPYCAGKTWNAMTIQETINAVLRGSDVTDPSGNPEEGDSGLSVIGGIYSVGDICMRNGIASPICLSKISSLWKEDKANNKIYTDSNVLIRNKTAIISKETDNSNRIYDQNNDRSINAIDIQTVINCSLGIGSSCSLADVNGDGKVDALDIQTVINAVLSGSDVTNGEDNFGLYVTGGIYSVGDICMPYGVCLSRLSQRIDRISSPWREDVAKNTIYTTTANRNVGLDNTGSFQIKDTGGTSRSILYYGGNTLGGDTLVIQNNSNGDGGDIKINTKTGVSGANPESMRINYLGNVGIGTADPMTKLHVKGAIAGQELFISNRITYMAGAGLGKVLTSNADGEASWKTVSEVFGSTGGGYYVKYKNFKVGDGGILINGSPDVRVSCNGSNDIAVGGGMKVDGFFSSSGSSLIGGFGGAFPISYPSPTLMNTWMFGVSNTSTFVGGIGGTAYVRCLRG